MVGHIFTLFPNNFAIKIEKIFLFYKNFLLTWEYGRGILYASGHTLKSKEESL